MLLLEINNLCKNFGEKKIIDIDDLKIYSGDKIGLIGLNGSGKSTLLAIINGELNADIGSVNCYGSVALINQIDNDFNKTNKSKNNNEFNENYAVLSGGEKTLLKIDKALKTNTHILLADEPTSNLSIKKIEELTNKLKKFKGALVLVSHDRSLINNVCNKIIEIEDAKITVYSGNYDFYLSQKSMLTKKQNEDYMEYTSNVKRLTETSKNIKKKAEIARLGKPKGSGNSEARLYINSIAAKSAKINKAAKIIDGRLKVMEKNKVTKPKTVKRTKIDVPESSKIYAKTLIEAKELDKKFGERIIFEKCSFKIQNNSKTALIGENGCGKTTLLKMIINKDEDIKLANKLEVGYFSQDLSVLSENDSIFQNVASTSKSNEAEIRGVLARLLFVGEDVFKLVKVLSGGEKVKVLLAKIFLSNVNMLILDEPNNFLDTNSMEELEKLIVDYTGSILIVTHDKSLLNVVNKIIVIEDKKINSFSGNYDEYVIEKNRKKEIDEKLENSNFSVKTKLEKENEILLLELELAKIIGELAMTNDIYVKEKLDLKFLKITQELSKIKHNNYQK